MRYLLEASIQMINRSVCSEWYQTFHVITNQHICAGEEDGRRDACSVRPSYSGVLSRKTYIDNKEVMIIRIDKHYPFHIPVTLVKIKNPQK